MYVVKHFKSWWFFFNKTKKNSWTKKIDFILNIFPSVHQKKFRFQWLVLYSHSLTNSLSLFCSSFYAVDDYVSDGLWRHSKKKICTSSSMLDNNNTNLLLPWLNIFMYNFCTNTLHIVAYTTLDKAADFFLIFVRIWKI